MATTNGAAWPTRAVRRISSPSRSTSSSWSSTFSSPRPRRGGGGGEGKWRVRAGIVSGCGDMVNIRTAMNRGAFDFVTKPVDLKDLEITIRKTLGDIARVRELERRRAAAERARTNLARYFSPNLVGLLADRDEPLGPVRRETVAVLFVDIVGFTRMAEKMAPEAVVPMLREFHRRMAAPSCP